MRKKSDIQKNRAKLHERISTENVASSKNIGLSRKYRMKIAEKETKASF